MTAFKNLEKLKNFKENAYNMRLSKKNILNIFIYFLLFLIILSKFFPIHLHSLSFEGIFLNLYSVDEFFISYKTG